MQLHSAIESPSTTPIAWQACRPDPHEIAVGVIAVRWSRSSPAEHDSDLLCAAMEELTRKCEAIEALLELGVLQHCLAG